METCERCGADLKGSSGCWRCSIVYERLAAKAGSFVSFQEWLEDVITTRIRAFIAAGQMDEAVDARIEEAIDKHENRYYHNRCPD